MSSQNAIIDTLRTLGNGSITGSYVAVDTPFTHSIRIFCITNNTAGDMLFSTDGVNDQIFVKAGTYKIYEISTNNETNCPFFLPAHTQFYVKQKTAPGSGDVYVEAIYGKGQ